MIRAIITAIALTGFLTAAVFGLAVMTHTDMGHGDCVAAQAQGSTCPLTVAGFVALHAGFLQGLTTAVFLLAVAAVLLLLALFAPALTPPGIGQYALSTVSALPNHAHRDRARWFARLELSPTGR